MACLAEGVSPVSYLLRTAMTSISSSAHGAARAATWKAERAGLLGWVGVPKNFTYSDCMPAKSSLPVAGSGTEEDGHLDDVLHVEALLLEERPGSLAKMLAAWALVSP